MNTLTERIVTVLAEIARDRGMNASQVAAAIGATRSAVSKWRTGETQRLKAEHLFAIEDRFGYAARWLRSGHGPKKITAASAPVGWESLSATQQRLVQVMIDTLLDTKVVDSDAAAPARRNKSYTDRGGID